MSQRKKRKGKERVERKVGVGGKVEKGPCFRQRRARVTQAQRSVHSSFSDRPGKGVARRGERSRRGAHQNYLIK